MQEIPLLDAAAAAAGDEAAVEAGDSWAGLMERAAGHLARGVVGAAGRGYGLRVAVLAGKGNNGGDGWAAARRLADHGATARVVSAPPLDEQLSEEAAANRRRWLDSGGPASGGLDGLDRTLDWCDVAVDALLGTGVDGAPRGAAGEAAEALLAAHAAGTTVVACDVPSGVSADDGTAPEGAVRADVTVTLGGMKRGLVLHPGAAHAGRVVVGGLGPDWHAESDWQALTAAGAAPTPWSAATDKRARGTLLAVSGSVGASGAAALCGRGALAAGAGLVTVATPEPARPEVAGHDPALMTRGIAVDHHGGPGDDAVGDLRDADGFDAVVAGPGLGHRDGAAAVVAHLRGSARRLVLDADAINVHRGNPHRLADHAGELVLTPHRRELARIGGGDDGDDAWGSRVERVPALAAEYDATIVAKGPGTMIAAPDGRVWVTPTGGPALGSGGTGDVLAGMVGAAAARVGARSPAGDLPLAVARAVWRHGWAGDLLAAGTAGRMTSSALADRLPGSLQALRRAAPHAPFDRTATRAATDA